MMRTVEEGVGIVYIGRGEVGGGCEKCDSGGRRGVQLGVNGSGIDKNRRVKV